MSEAVLTIWICALVGIGSFAAGYLMCKAQILAGWLKAPMFQVNVSFDDALVLQHLRQQGYLVQLEKRKVN